MFKSKFIVLMVLSCSLAASPSVAENLWIEIAKNKNIDPYELYAIALVESRRVWTDGQVRPWPYTLMIQGKKNASVFMPDRDSADTLLKLLLENGVNNVDVCCMQINLATHMGTGKFNNPSDLFELRKCVEVGADILKIALKSTKDKELGLGRYHHWKNEKISRKYGKKVIVLANSLRETKIFEN